MTTQVLPEHRLSPREREISALKKWQQMVVLSNGHPAKRIEEFFPLAEATALNDQARVARVIIISEGLGNLRDKNFYTKEAVQSAKAIFEGRQCYIDHPGVKEEDDRPERSIRDLCGYFYGCEVGSVTDPDTGEKLAALYGNLRLDESVSGEFALKKIKSALEYQKRFPEAKDVYAGISINGGGVSHPGTIRGMEVNMVTEISEAFSADIVTKPARGGRFLALMQEAARLAAWKRKTARKSREARVGQKESTMAVQAVLVRRAKESGKKKGKRVREGGENEARQGLRKAAELVRAVTAKLNDNSGDPTALVADLKADIDQLAQMIGGAPGEEGEEAMPDDVPAGGDVKQQTGEDEATGVDNTGTGRGKPTGPHPGKLTGVGGGDEEEEAEDEEKEAEDEDEKEARREARGDEQEADEEGEEEEAEQDEEGEEEAAEMYEPGGEEDEEGAYGMSGEEEQDGGGAPATMQYRCAKCGEVNEVAPPKGFRLARMGESVKAAVLAFRETCRRLRRTLQAKEARFVRSNVQHSKLVEKLQQENIRLKATVIAHNRLAEAKRLLAEAGIPKDILSAPRLIAFEPHQWPQQIAFAKRLLKRESTSYRGGAGPGGASVGRTREAASSAKEAIATFQGSYKPERGK